MKTLFYSFLFLFSISIFGQTNYKITYLKSSNGKLIENQDAILVFSNEKQSLISSEAIINEKSEFPFEQTIITNLNYLQVANLSKIKTIATKDSTSIGKQSFELQSETKKIVGYNCKKAKIIINSNTIEIWYTNDLKVKGAPTVLGQNLGLVLEMNRNGNFVITATKVERIKQFPILKVDENKTLDVLTYRDLLWKSRFTSISIFKDEVINFSDASKSNDSILRFANGTIILKKIKIPAIAKGSQVFIDVTEQSNGDAYDRTGSVFMIPMDKKMSFLDGLQNGVKTLPIYDNGNGKQYQGIVSTENYSPLIELMRFFTPFGIKQYNTIQLKDKIWEERVSYRQDISELTSALNNQEVYIGTFIGNYDKGGHKVSVNITIHPEEEIVAKAAFAIPLFNSTNVMEMAGQEYGTLFNSDKGLLVTFTLNSDLKNAKLRYITTGHGGWENGDEFVPKKNTIYLDEKEVFHFTPWREDCGSYRLYNPASGNFPNGLSSSDYSRSNWCPGMVTNPTYIDLGDLKAGIHTIQVKILQGANEGTSFSSWNVSGVLIGN
ncbi:PNGase F N-terminal domain-containing protein [Flavobacterium sp. SUN052]|uniref:PNGase F N-terminal domain-containing protein n=1 Tax=Flavobacterium sp. SUN052 TaxID=3002441 RepID=UPI00237E06CD|nr:PNGase F N-terminal domain-containing protein [Flavobacterium sp. SUN052]MEC4004783.1 PNGase F N-terminal domain-containing protein [Flavobacterium sp. SUN052]